MVGKLNNSTRNYPSIRTPAALIILSNFKISLRVYSSIASGVLGAGVCPAAVSRAMVSALARALAISPLSRITRARGVFAGATMLYQVTTSNPGQVSFSVGVSGASGERLTPPTASRLSLPALAWGSAVAMLPNNDGPQRISLS